MIKMFNWKMNKKDSVSKSIKIEKNDAVAKSASSEVSIEGDSNDNSLVQPLASTDAIAVPTKTGLAKGKNPQAKKKQVKHQKNLKFIHMEPFVLHSIKLNKKDILKFIKNKSMSSLGDDYYYSYSYANGVLNFISVKSTEHATGCLPAFTYAFLNPGHYYYNQEKSKKFYFLVNKNGFVKLEVGTAEDLKPEHKNLQQLNNADFLKLPKTIFFEWSLQKSASIALGSSIVVFACSLIIALGISLQQNNYKDTISRSMRAVSEIKSTYEKISPVDVVSVIKSISEKTQGSGYVRYVKFDKANTVSNQKSDKLSYELVFNQLSLAEAFAKENGVQNDKTSVRVETSSLKIK